MSKKLFFLILIVLTLASGVVFAATNDFSINWWTVDSGGGTSQGGDFSVSGSVGQPDAGEPMSGGSFTVVGGYWEGAVAPTLLEEIFMPLIIR